MKIISRYVVREHAGPFAFALIALTSLMLLNFISRQMGELVGKGLPWKVIGQFFMLSIPFTIALTVPMSVLVAVLYAYTRLASENEVTALKANGVSPWRLVTPAIIGGVFMSMGLLAFNDQVLPRANHELSTLQSDISQARPTLLLKDQVINSIAEGKFYLKAGKVDQAGGRLLEVVIYDLADATRRRTIYADSGHIAFASNRKDLLLDLFHGQMQEVATDKPTQLDRMFFSQDRIRIRDVQTGGFKTTETTDANKGDREMGVCEMQKRLWLAQNQFDLDLQEYQEAKHPPKPAMPTRAAPPRVKSNEPHGLGWAYCALLKRVGGVRAAHAADVRSAGLHAVAAQDTTPKKKADSAAVVPTQDTVPKQAAVAGTVVQKLPADTMPRTQVPVGTVVQKLPADTTTHTQAPVVTVVQKVSSDTSHLTQEQIAARAAAELMHPPAAPAVAPASASTAFPMSTRLSEAKLRLDMSQLSRDRYAIEINKKFSLAAACLIFCIVAPPIALRFPRGGVGLVIGVSLAVFALYYVGLIGGEAAANKGLVPPFWAMWATNVIMTLVGTVMLLRMGRDFGSARGGGVREWLDQRRFLRDERRAAAKQAAAPQGAA